MPLDFESWQKMMAEQQAQFWADLKAIEARQVESARLFEENRRLSEENRQNIAKLVDVCMSLTNHAEEADRRLGELGQETDGRFRETDERVNILVDVVDKLVKRNGRDTKQNCKTPTTIVGR